MKKTFDWTRWLALLALFALSYTVFYAVALRPASDLSIHATWASEGDFANPRSFFHHGAHPLWHMLVALVLMTGLPLSSSAALVTALCKVAEAWLLMELAAQILGRRNWLSTLVGLTAALVSALWVPWINPTVYLGAGSPNPWHSPTQMAAMVLMLLCVPLTARCVETFQRNLPTEGARANVTLREAALLSVLLVLSLAAKPTFLQAFLPAACLYFLGLWIRKPRNSPYFLRMMAAAAPAVLLMVLQYLYYFGIIVPSQGDMVLEITPGKALDVLGSALLTQAFPLFVLFACADRETLRKPLYSLALWMDGISILEMLFLSETGRRASDGNFGWAMMGAALLLWALTLPLFVRRVRGYVHRRRACNEGQPYLESKPRAEAARWLGGLVLLAWHLGSGLYYLIYLLTSVNPL